MAIKSIVAVEVDRQAWDRFQESFTKFQADLKQTGADTKSISGGFAGISGVTSNAWRDLARDSKSVAAHIGSATESLLKWASVTGLISGLLGVGGLFGIERLAASAGNLRRSSLGLNATPGEQRGFAATFGRLSDPGQLLGGVNEALHDVTKRIGLYGAGLSEGDIRGKDTGQVAELLVPALKRLADQTPENMLAQVLRARHLDQFITLEDFERYKHTPAAEIAGYQQEYQKRRRDLELTQQQQKAWQDLQVQLHFAGMSIETTFIRRLTPLVPQINRLSAAFTGLVSSLLKSPEVSRWVDEAATGLGHLAAYIGTPKFSQDVTEFVRDVGLLARGVASALHWLAGWFADEDKKGGKKGAPNLIGPNKDLFPKDWWHNHPTSPSGKPPAPGYGGPPIGGQPVLPGGATPGSFSALETIYKLPTGLLNAVYGAESSYGRDVSTSSAGAQGPFQFLPGTARQYGVANPMDLGQASEGAARYFRKLLNEFGGDVAKAAAGYNWGEGNVERDLAQWGAAWREHLPGETRRYVDRVTREQAQSGGQYQSKFRDRSVQVVISNTTGGNATVTASQLAAGSI
jgi:hypothetical protein